MPLFAFEGREPDVSPEAWIAPTPPSEEILELALRVAERAPALRAVTVDAFSPSLTADELMESMARTRKAFEIG